jgi:hypothetical protein
MKHLTKIFVLLFTLTLLSGSSLAQDNEQPLLITSFNMVTMSDVGKVNKLVDSVFTPILKELVDEGMIYSFGQFNHSWGDEWNVNFWYTAKDMTSFDKFWDEYVTRVRERHPTAHKDNIYTIRGQYPVPPQK